MKRSIERKLPLSDWELLTIGQIIDYIIFYNEDEREIGEDTEDREATQNDFERF